MFAKILALLSAVGVFLSTIFCFVCGGRNKNIPPQADILPDTWAATDGLGRTLPMAGEVRQKDEHKFVGMFYWTWHTHFADSFEALNVSEILAGHPEILHDFDSPIWGNMPDGRPYYWSRPLLGYYRDTDEYVLRKHAELLADAGVDVIFFDCTNGTSTWDESCEALFAAFEKAKADGVRVPKVAFMLPFNNGSDTTVSLKHLYERIYSKDRYRDLWFFWDDKPLILAHASGLNTRDKTEREIYRFFTFRKNEPGYFAADTRYLQKTWGWCSDYPQTRFGRYLNGKTEQMCVSVAQNADSGALVAMNSGGNVQGRSFAKGDYFYRCKSGDKMVTVRKDDENAMLYGLNFQQQWDNAIAANPEFIFVTGWNEWIAGRWKEWEGTKNAFPDQFSDEYSRDIEPADSILKDHFYYQLVANIRRFKGVSDRTKETDGIKIYDHYTGSTPARNSDGWQGTHYESDTMRNDFVRVCVSDDGNTITFKIFTKDPITSPANAWMRILIDTNASADTPNWEGFEYVLDRENASDGALSVERSAGGWNFVKTGEAAYSVNGSEMTVVVPAAALGLEGEIHFNFKLSDNMQTDGDVMDFYKFGDTAPGGRFMFVY